jgi:hypothetical protein
MGSDQSHRHQRPDLVIICQKCLAAKMNDDQIPRKVPRSQEMNMQGWRYHLCDARSVKDAAEAIDQLAGRDLIGLLYEDHNDTVKMNDNQ